MKKGLSSVPWLQTFCFFGGGWWGWAGCAAVYVKLYVYNLGTEWSVGDSRPQLPLQHLVLFPRGFSDGRQTVMTQECWNNLSEFFPGVLEGSVSKMLKMLESFKD